MIFIIISVIVGICMLVYALLGETESIIGKILSFFFGIPLGTLIGGFVGILIAGMFGGILYLSDVEQETKFISETPIYSVVDNQGLNGQFSLGYGRVSDELKYYYVVHEKLGERVNSITADCTHIKNTNSTPKLKIYEQDFKHKVWWLLGLNFKAGNSYVIEVPKNTVKYDYNIDLK